jgi:hypothetical protein
VTPTLLCGCRRDGSAFCYEHEKFSNGGRLAEPLVDRPAANGEGRNATSEGLLVHNEADRRPSGPFGAKSGTWEDPWQ